jgi:hypothetical protein
MRRLALLVLALPLALGCGSDKGGNGGNGGITDPVDTGDFPLGTFVKTLEESDVEDLVPEQLLPIVVGSYSITYNSDGRFSLSFVGDGTAGGASGTFSVSGDEITVTETGILGHCVQADAPSGTYTWSFDGSALNFSVVSDDCQKRMVSTTTKPFIKE